MARLDCDEAADLLRRFPNATAREALENATIRMDVGDIKLATAWTKIASWIVQNSSDPTGPESRTFREGKLPVVKTSPI